MSSQKYFPMNFQNFSLYFWFGAKFLPQSVHIVFFPRQKQISDIADLKNQSEILEVIFIEIFSERGLKGKSNVHNTLDHATLICFCIKNMIALFQNHC